MINHGGRKESGAPRAKMNWIALLSGILVFLVFFIPGRTIARKEDENLRFKIKAECDHLVSLTELDVRNRIPALQRTISRWDALGVMTQEDFTREIEAFEADVPGFQAIDWCDGNGIIHWVVPLAGNEQAVNLDMKTEPNRSATLFKVRDRQVPAMSNPLELVQGGSGVIIIFPIRIRDRQAGYLLAVFRIGEWMEYIFNIEKTAPNANDFRVSVSIDGTPVYAQTGWNELKRNEPDISSVFSMLDHKFTITLRPEKNFITRTTTLMPIFLTQFGALIAILVVCIIWLYMKSRDETRRLLLSQKTLEAEIAERKKVERELQHAFSRIDWATKAAHMGVWSWNLADDKLEWSPLMYKLFKLPDDVSPVYAIWRNALHPDDTERVERLLNDAVAGKSPFDTVFRIIWPDGSVRHLRGAARVERDEHGKALSMNGLNWDVTNREETETALKNSEAKVRLLLNSTGEAIYGIDLKGDCTFANPACARILGYTSPEELLGKNMHRLIHYARADGSPMILEECKIYRAFREGKPSHVDDEILWKADETSFPAEYWSYPQIADGEITGAVVTFVDITERKKAEETIRYMATHDGLTNLPSLILCRDRLGMAITQSRRDGKNAAVMFIDLDGFKGVNDTWGHDAGDAVLKETANRLRESVRESDTVARIGGDEFLAVITELQSRDNAEAIARKMLANLTEPFVLDRTSVRIGASIGITLFPRGKKDDVESLIKLADQAMYSVKKSGKNGIRFADE